MSWGIRYVIIAAGAPNEPCNEEDIEFIQETVESVIPYKTIILSPNVSDKLTVALLHERGTI